MADYPPPPEYSAEPPKTDYPPPPQQGYPPQAPVQGYPQAPVQGYPPPQQGYPPPQQGYPPPQQQGYPPQTVVVQPGVIVTSGASVFGQYPTTCVCPHCRAQVSTSLEYTNGTLVWLMVGILFVIGWWLCCWIPCVVDGLKDVTHKCPSCHNVIGQYRRM